MSKNQVATVLKNDTTKQFFITFNNEDARTKGASRILGNHKWLEKRIAEIKGGVQSIEDNPGILHALDNGINWAIRNSNVKDWHVSTREESCTLEEVMTVEHDWASKLEKLGYVNVRIKKAKGPEARIWAAYKWGSWNPNMTFKNFRRRMDNVMTAMNKQIPDKIINKAWLACVSPKSTISNKYDLWCFFEREGLFG